MFLIVDDNSLVRRTIVRFVRDLTNHVIECANGAQALPAYQANLPEWVLMDIEMKHLDGLTATREICAAYPKARVVTVTNYNDDGIYNQPPTVSRQTNFAGFDSSNRRPESPAAPFTFTLIQIAGQGLPPGLSLAPDGTISGMPMQAGTFTFTVKATDADVPASADESNFNFICRSDLTNAFSRRPRLTRPIRLL